MQHATAPEPSWRRNQFVLTAVSFMGFTGFTLVMPFLPLYIEQLGSRDVGEVAMWSGLSLGATPALTALLSPAWGRVADRFGRKLMIERSLLSFVVIMSLMAFVTKPWHVFALRAFQGLFAGYGALALAMAAEIAPRDEMASAIGLVQTAQRLGPALGPIIGGAVAAVFGLRRAFFVTASFYLLALLLMLFGYKEKLPARGAEDAGRKNRASFHEILSLQDFPLLVALIFGLQFVDRSFGPILPLHVGLLGVRTARVPLVSGVLFSVLAFAAALGHYLAGHLLRRFPTRALLVAGSIAAGVGVAACLIAPDPVTLGFGLGLCAVGVGGGMTLAYTAAGLVVPEGRHASAFGILSASWLAGLAISPILSGLIATFHLKLVFLINLAVLVAAALAVRRGMGDGGR